MTVESRERWGGASARSGATDTTMLIWKVVNANPGITRQGIWEKIEHEIPTGYALRRYANSQKPTQTLDHEQLVERARRFVLTHALGNMAVKGILGFTAGTRTMRQYVTLREIRRYNGDPDKIDATGTVAAEHLNTAYALRTARAWQRRTEGHVTRCSARERAALVTVMDALDRFLRGLPPAN